MDIHIKRIADSSHGRSFIGRSDARIVDGADETALMHAWSDRPRLAEPEQFSDDSRQTHLCDHVNAKPSPCPIRAAHAELIATVKGHPPRAIPIDLDAVDLEDRADHLNKVLNALSTYVTAIIDDTAQNIPGGLDLGDISAVLSDLASDMTGTIQLAADAMAGRLA